MSQIIHQEQTILQQLQTLSPAQQQTRQNQTQMIDLIIPDDLCV